MTTEEERLEQYWDGILSREATAIRAAFNSVDPASQSETLAHLQNMIADADYLPVQRESARIAYEVLTATNDEMDTKNG